MIYYYLHVVLAVLGPLASLAAVLVPVILYFKNRNNTNFAKQIKTIAIVDAVYLVLWILSSISAGTIVQSPDSILTAIFFLAGNSAVLFCVWKMKEGKGFKSLFKNPGINPVLFVVYMVANFVIFYQLAITLINYLIAGIVFIVIFLIADRFLGLGAGRALMSSSGGGGIHKTCGSCSRYIDGKCADDPRAMASPMGSCANWRP